MQFFVDGLAHFFQPRAIVGLQILDARFQRGAHFGHALGVGFGERGQALVEGVAETFERSALLFAADLGLLIHRKPHAVELLGIGFVEFDQLLGEAVDLGVLQRGDAADLGCQGLLQLGEIGAQFLPRALRGGLHLVAQVAFGAFGQVLLMALQITF